MMTFRSRSCRPGAVSVNKCLGQRRGVERGARWPRRQPRLVSSARVLGGPSDCFPQGEARGLRAPRELHAVATTFTKPQPLTWRSVGEEEPRPTARGERVAARWPRRKLRQVRQRARAPWAVGRLSTERNARGSRGMGAKCGDHDNPKPQPPTWYGVGEEEPRPTACGRASRAFLAKTTARSPPARAYSLGRRPVLHGTKRARAVHHGG